MTTKRQQAAVHFCEQWLHIPFKEDINDFTQVSNYLATYLDKAKQIAEEVSCEYIAYINDLN